MVLYRCDALELIRQQFSNPAIANHIEYDVLIPQQITMYIVNS